MQVIPAIDIKDGQCVRLHQGRFDRVTDYPVTPAGQAQRYAALGASPIHLVDLDGARSGGEGNRELVLELLRTHPGRLQVGGGVRDLATAEALIEAGAARVVVGSTAVENPDAVYSWIDAFGEALVLNPTLSAIYIGFENGDFFPAWKRNRSGIWFSAGDSSIIHLGWSRSVHRS